MKTTSPLVGREHACALLRTAVVDASRGHGSLTLVAGDPGIGKTALVSHIADERPAVLARTVWGRALDGLGSPGYWPWTQVFRQLGILAPGQHLGDAADDRFRLFEQVASALEEVSRDGGLLVVLDDLQWADADSLALLELVGRSLTDRRIAVIGTYRDTEAGDGLKRLARAAEVLTLHGLSESLTAQLMRELGQHNVTPDQVSRIHQRTGGNPFFVRELTRLSQLRGQSGQPEGTVELVESVRDVIERRLARLSQPCARLLVTAALDGTAVRPWVLHKVVDDEVDVSALLDEASQARILKSDAGALRFAHDLFREVVVAGLPPPRRREAHLLLARALESGRREGRPVHAAELAAQFAAAAAPDDRATEKDALRYAREAADESTRRLAFDDAATHLARALTALDTTGPSPDTRLQLLLEVAGAQHAAGRSTEAAGTYREAWTLAGAVADPIGQARAALGLHAVGIKTGPSGDRDAQAAILESAAAAVASLDPALHCDLISALARTLYHSMESGRMDRARDIAAENLKAARALGSADVLIRALRARHDVEWSPGTAAERLAVLDELAQLVRPDDLELRLLRAQALLELGDPSGVALVNEVSNDAELTGRPAARWLAASRRAASALLSGRLDEAATQIERAEAIALRLGDDDARWVTDIQRWELARFARGRAGFVRHRPDGEPKVERWPPWQSLILADAGECDDAAKALGGFRAAEAYGPGVNAGYDLWFPAIAAEAIARSGTDRVRAEMYDLLAPYAGTQVGCGAWVAYCGPVDGYLADLALARGDSTAGAAHLRAAEAQCQRLGATCWMAWLSETAARHAVAVPLEGNSLTRNGPVWTVTFGGAEALVPANKGMLDIAILLARPHQSISAAELAGTLHPDRGEPVLDRRALAAYRARIDQLTDDIDDADHDLERANKARMEREALLDELRRATGHHGRARRLGDDSERVRKTVRARVHRALVVVAEHHPQLADHLRDTIETGGWCTYRPAEPVTWKVTI